MDCLTSFKSNFIERSYYKIPQNNLDTTTEKGIITGEGIVVYCLIDNNSEPCIPHTKMYCTL